MTRFVALTFLTLVFLPIQAEAGCAHWGWRQICNRDWPVPSCWNQRYCQRRERDEPDYRRYDPRPERVFGYERRSDEVSIPLTCRTDLPPFSATGDDKLDEERARLSAQERWSIEVSNRLGGLWSDIRNAYRMTAACWQVVPSSLTERTQATIGLRHNVCRVEGHACAAPKIPQDEDTRAKRPSERRSEDVAPKARIEQYEVVPAPRRRWYQRYRRETDQ